MSAVKNKKYLLRKEVLGLICLNYGRDNVLSKLTKRGSDLLLMRYGLDGREALGVDAIAKTMRLSTARIMQIESATFRQVLYVKCMFDSWALYRLFDVAMEPKKEPNRK